MTIPSDKGGKIVALDSTSYREKAYKLLNDAQVYEKLADDKILKRHNAKVNAYLLKLKNDKIIDNKFYLNLKETEPQTP